jgi:hypothetical protein
MLYSAFMSGSDVYGPAPSWWPYATELPYWHVWRGVSGLLYARRLNSSPPVVVRGEDVVDLRDQIRREQFLRWGEEELHKPGDEFRSSG